VAVAAGALVENWTDAVRDRFDFGEGVFSLFEQICARDLQAGKKVADERVPYCRYVLLLTGLCGIGASTSRNQSCCQRCCAQHAVPVDAIHVSSPCMAGKAVLVGDSRSAQSPSRTTNANWSVLAESIVVAWSRQRIVAGIRLALAASLLAQRVDAVRVDAGNNAAIARSLAQHVHRNCDASTRRADD
jgi:hypothetical protein